LNTMEEGGFESESSDLSELKESQDNETGSTTGEHDTSLQQRCRQEIENLHGIFVCWFKGLQPKEDLEEELLDRISAEFTHIAPNGQILKGQANLMQNLSEKYNVYPAKVFDVEIENVEVIWTHNDLCLVSYEEWQWWRDTDSNKKDLQENENAIRFGRVSSCLLKQRAGNFLWLHVHEAWLEEGGSNDVSYSYNGNNGDSKGSAPDTKATSEMGIGINGNAQFPSYLKFSTEKDQGESKKSISKDSKLDKKKEEKKGKVASVKPVTQTLQVASTVSSRRHISPQLTDYAKACVVNNELIGISVHGWDIGTGQGPMGDESWFSAATTNFENVSQYNGAFAKARRRLALPEMVFPAAHVAFEHRKDNLWISWDVLDALDDWARAHQTIPVGSGKAYKGVSVLKSEDAALWAKKKKNILPDNESKDQFHFDWTYSTPFCGSVEGGSWDPLPKSGLKLDMLKDKSVPILFFDELILYEDDMHDNGHVQFSLKIRVMPTCGFVLARSWVRIDRVLLRLKETRVMFEFCKVPEESTHIYRDVTWRECHWKDLGSHSLPTDLRSWASEGQETPQLAMLMAKLPEIELPRGIHKHAVLKRSPK